MSMDMEHAGALAGAALVAHEIEGQGAGGKPAAAHPANCANCNTALAGSFCHACGQHAHVHRSLLHLIEEVAHGILHFDTKAWRTLPMLVVMPGRLTRSYVEGQRARFVSPLALFLFMVFFMFFVASLTSKGAFTVDKDGVEMTLPELEQEIVKARAGVEKAKAAVKAASKTPGQTAEAVSGLTDAIEELSGLETAADLLKGKVGGKTVVATKQGDNFDFKADTGWPAADAALRHAQENPELALYKLKSTGSKFTFLLVPITLPFLWLMFFWRRNVKMYDHAVFSLYSLSFMSLLLSTAFVLKFAGMKSWAAGLMIFLPPIHMYLQLRGAYQLSGWGALWRTFGLLFIVSIVVTLYLLIILVLSLR